MGNTCGLSRGSRGTALISRPWEATLIVTSAGWNIRSTRRVLHPCFANARFVYLCNPYATKGVFAVASKLHIYKQKYFPPNYLIITKTPEKLQGSCYQFRWGIT